VGLGMVNCEAAPTAVAQVNIIEQQKIPNDRGSWNQGLNSMSCR
jgi:hypothetical protein